MSVSLLDMGHQCGESPGVSIPSGLTERRNGRSLVPIGIQSPEISSGIGLDPERRIGGFAVLPGSEPQQTEVQVPFLRRLQEMVHQGEVKLSFYGLEQFPAYRRKHGVESQGFGNVH